MDVVAQLAAVVAPVFICAGIGFAWARLGYAFDSQVVTSLVYNVGAPCLILATFAKVDLGADALAAIAGAALACYAGFAAIGFAILKAARLAPSSYLPALMFPLTGSMGLPVCLFAFGDAGLALALVYFTISMIGTFTVGDAVAAGKVSLGRLARTSVVYAVALAVGLELAHIDLPAWAVNTTRLLGGIVIPAQLIALGISLAKLRVGSFGRSLWLGCMRLGMGLAVGIGVAELFGLAGLAWSVVVVQSAMPVAVSSYLFAELHRREPEEVAGMVLTSTAISFATLPLLLLVVM
jgi:predicted permease